MPKVRAFSIGGLELMFYTNDHLPPHFHAIKCDEWEYRVFFLNDTDVMFEYVWHRREASGKARREIAALVVPNRESLLVEWESARGLNDA